MKLSETTVRKSENLHLMRFVASVMVIFAHSYAISGSPLGSDFVYRYTNGLVSIGGICVALFFICSGYLISKSVAKTDKFVPYIKARLKRLLPPLAFVVVITVMVGAVITSLPIGEYFTSFKTYKYLLNAIMLVNHELPGVFGRNAYGTAVNGSLWTLPVEAACYVACFLFYKWGLLGKKRFWYTLPPTFLAVIFEDFVPGILGDMIRPCVFFYIGMFYYVYREHIELKIWAAAAALSLLVFCFAVKVLILPALMLLFPYVLFTLWFACPQCSARWGRTGDISYSVYLWGFFVQQLLVFIWGGTMPQILNFVLSTAVAVILGIITFLVTEKPFLKRKEC